MIGKNRFSMRWTVVCPLCGSLPGSMCRNTIGELVPTHLRRVSLAMSGETMENTQPESSEPANCGNCRFYVNYRCRRYPPAMVPYSSLNAWEFAGVDKHDWCGEFQSNKETD